MDQMIKRNPARLTPNVRLFGSVDEAMLAKVMDSLQSLPSGENVILELTTQGGDADMGRRIALELRLARERGHETIFIGKSNVMSAGITIMSCFPASLRFVDKDCELLIHERRLEKTLQISGPLRSNIQIAKELIAQLESGQRLEEKGFRDLVQDTGVTFDELMSKVAHSNWYLSAEEACRLGIVAGVF
jgi:ATP-dependent protease ClpP protease subunit